jgi:hypothetical protein
MKTLLGALLSFIALVSITAVVVLSINFNRNCGGYLKRAADSNSTEMAKGELSKAITYLESRGDTIGYTSIIYKTPDEDIAFWYHNLKSAWSQLNEIGAGTTELEKTNILMKLRETLLDNGGESGDKLTVPQGISKFPHNGLWAFILTLGILSLCGACIILVILLEDI